MDPALQQNKSSLESLERHSCSGAYETGGQYGSEYTQVTVSLSLASALGWSLENAWIFVQEEMQRVGDFDIRGLCRVKHKNAEPKPWLVDPGLDNQILQVMIISSDTLATRGIKQSLWDRSVVPFE
jgi:hypothetical protein